jgi:hypothetical protein
MLSGFRTIAGAHDDLMLAAVARGFRRPRYRIRQQRTPWRRTLPENLALTRRRAVPGGRIAGKVRHVLHPNVVLLDL